MWSLSTSTATKILGSDFGEDTDSDDDIVMRLSKDRSKWRNLLLRKRDIE